MPFGVFWFRLVISKGFFFGFLRFAYLDKHLRIKKSKLINNLNSLKKAKKSNQYIIPKRPFSTHAGHS